MAFLSAFCLSFCLLFLVKTIYSDVTNSVNQGAFMGDGVFTSGENLLSSEI